MKGSDAVDQVVDKKNTKETITNEMIEKAIKMAIKEYAKEEKKGKRKKALHNTKLLLKSYKKIKNSIDEAVSEARQLEHDYYSLNDADDIYIESIRRSKLKSLIVITHIDKALAIVQEECKKKGYPEKYDAFISCMIEQMNYDEAAEKYISSKTSISRWINDITKEISVQLFGVDGIELI